MNDAQAGFCNCSDFILQNAGLAGKIIVKSANFSEKTLYLAKFLL